MLITPSSCQTGWQIGTSVTANGTGATASTGTKTFDTTANCTQAFNPTFSATLSDYTAGAHPNLNIAVGTNNGTDTNVRTIKNFNVKLPVGLVANTTNVARCPQADATAGTCVSSTPSSAVGTISTEIGAAAERLSLSGTVYNVVPGSNEPAHLAALIPVQVGPFNLGNMPVDISTALNDGTTDSGTRTYGVDTFSTLPERYEGIDVRVRAVNLTINGMVGGQPFMINPSACLSGTIGADLKAGDGTTVSRTSAANFTGCNRPYTDTPTLTVTPSTKAAGQPVGLTFDLGTTLNNPTTKGVKLTFPAGFELNPAAGTGLAYCSDSNLASNQAACDSNGSKLGTVTLTTPLLSNPQTGAVYLEQPGNTASTRYKTAIVVHLPGKDLILHGQVLVDGSSTIPTGGTGAVDSGTGQISAEFSGIPDLGFSTMKVAFNSGSNALFVNPTACTASQFSAIWTPNGTGATKTVTDGYTPDTNCSQGFAPTFAGGVTPLTSAGNPDVTLTFNRPDNNLNLRKIVVNLPTGLVANTTATTRCSQATAAAGGCAANQVVGSVGATIGSGSATYPLSGSLYNVAANADEPARFAAIMPVVVGPFDLGKLSIPVTTALNADYSITATAQLPLRYEGIAVRVRSLQMGLAKTAATGNAFMVNPSICSLHTISTTMTSEGGSPQTATGSFGFTPTSCAGFTGNTSIAVTSDNSTPAAPAGLIFNINSDQGNPTFKRIQLTFPDGMDINPSFANGLATCSTAVINAGGSGCPSGSQIATVSLTTPLLAATQTGKVYLENPGNTKDDRYKLAMIIDLPGQKLTVRGQVRIDGSSDIPTASTGATGTVDTGSGVISADFDNIPDLGFTNLTMTFNGGSNAMVVNPETCTNSFNAIFTPNSNTGATRTTNPSYPLTGCGTSPFNVKLTATNASTAPAGHGNLGLKVERPNGNKLLKAMTIHLPTGMVANTSAVTTPCSQASAAAASCATTAASSQVGTFTTAIGESDSSLLSLTGGKIFQVTPNANEPARFAAIIPVVVGPYNLGNMTIPVATTLRADYGIDINATLPQRYEGIKVRLRSLDMQLASSVNSKSYMTNPSKCATHTISADFTASDNSTDLASGGNGADNSSTFTTTGCNATMPPYNPTVTTAVSPATAGTPTALTMGIALPDDNATTNRVQLAFPQGMELNPGVGNTLVACSTIDSDASSTNPCKLTTSNLASITLNTPLLPNPVSGEVYLETPGNTAATRYKMALVLHLPGRDMVIHGSSLVNGSSNVTGGLGSTDAAGTATGQVSADFAGIPDLGFTNMSIAFSSSNKLFVNPKTAGSYNVATTLTPNSTSTTTARNGSFSVSGGTSTVTAFNPTFSAALSSSTSAGNPDLSLNVGNPLGMKELKKFDVKLPVGLVAYTKAGGVSQCPQADANAATCAATTAASWVGTVTTTFGSSDTVGEDYTVLGDIYNVVPGADSPARLQAVVPVQVGPFDFGKLTVPVPTTLNSDLSVTASATLPSRYEGIAVRVRQMNMVIKGEPTPGAKFIVAPSKCGAKTIAATMTSDASDTSTINSGITINGCGNSFAASPTFQATNSAGQTSMPRTTPTNFTFKVTSSFSNPTMGRVQVAMPVGTEINPGFANNLQVCSTSTIDSDATNCPNESRIGTVSLKTQLLDPNTVYSGNVYLEQGGATGDTRYRVAMVVSLPGAKLVVHGKVKVNGSSDITGGTGATDSGTGQITADFDSIPDLGFTELSMAFSSTNPMLITPQPGGTQAFSATFTPSSADEVSDDRTATSNITTTPTTGVDVFQPNFSVTVGGGSSATAGSHPNLGIHYDRPTGINQRYLRQLDLDLPLGLVASTTATSHCSQADANAGNCDTEQIVGDFDSFIGNGTSDAANLNIQGGIYNVEPDANEPARLAAITNVLVGPYDLGKLVIPVSTKLNSDLTVSTKTTIPKRYEGIAVRLSKMDITLYGQAGGNSFVSVPSKCGTYTVTGHLTSDTGSTPVDVSSDITTTGCPQNFFATPTVDVTATPADTTVPTGLGVTINSNRRNSTISRFLLTLPDGMSLNAAAGNGLATCSTAAINAGGSTCPAGSNQGTVTLETPLLSGQKTGNVYLEDPGVGAANRYKLAIVVHLPGTDLVLRGKVNVDGSSNVTGGLGATDTGTGRITTDFDTVPDLAFSKMTVNFNTGPRALLTNPDSCGTQTVTSAITPSSSLTPGNPSGTAATATSTYSLSNTAGCTSSKPFNPAFSASADNKTSGANTNLSMTVSGGAKDEYLRQFKLHLPVGLVADTTATNTTCTQSAAAAANCPAASQVGEVTTKLGTGSETLDMAGTIYNVVPSSDEPARMAVIVPVVVGPYDLGKLTVPVSTHLREGDYGVDATATMPYRYEGISVRIAELDMKLYSKATQGTSGDTSDDKGFIKNPSRCDDGSNTKITAELTPLNGSAVNRSAAYEVNGCPRNFSPKPSLTISGTNGQTAQPTGMTLQIDSDPANPTIGKVVTTMPDGMTLNPSVVANIPGGLQSCSTAAIDAGGSACPSGSKIGDISLVTPLLPGTKFGSVYLETPGTTAATRYKIAMIVDLPGTKMVVRGTTAVDGSSDITNGTGSTDTGTGRVIATFDNIPDLGFTQLKITFASGQNALFTNSETAGTQTVSAAMTPQSGGAVETSDGTYSTVYGGSGSQASEPFNPTFDATVNKPGETPVNQTQAAGNPDVTLTVGRSDYTQQIREFDLHLPKGLVANTVLTPRCDQAVADAGNCAAASKVGSVTTKIGTGGSTSSSTDLLTMTGDLFNVKPNSDEPARLYVTIPVQVGPYNLGKLNLPVATQIVTGSTASDLTIDTHTVIPQRYEGMPVRIRQMQIKINGTVNGQPFMISPSRCGTHTLEAAMTAPGGASVTPSKNFTTTNCDNAEYHPTVVADPSTTERGKPVGLDLSFKFSGNSSSTKKITTTFPVGMNVNPGIGNYGSGMTCDESDVKDGGAACPASSRLGFVSLDTPLLPNDKPNPNDAQDTTTHSAYGAIYLLPPLGNQASTRYRLGLYVELPGASLYSQGQVNVDGTSDVPTGGTGNVGSGQTGQVTATFDDLPDLQFTDMTIHFKTTGSGEHALLTNPRTCGDYAVQATMDPWAWQDRPVGQRTAPAVQAPFTVTGGLPGCTDTQSAAIKLQMGDPTDTAHFDDPSSDYYKAGSSQDVTLTVNRPDTDTSIMRTKFFLPAGLVGSADAAPTCADADSAAGNCGTTEPNSKVGEVTLAIGDSSDTYTVTGDLFNVVAPSDRPAKLSFAADINVGPFHMGKVVVPINVNLDNNDYSLFAETDDMPQMFEGIPVRISQMKVLLKGTSLVNKSFMTNPHSCQDTLSVRARIQDANGTWYSPADAPLAGPFHGCDGLNLDGDTVTVDNVPISPETGHKAEHPTGINVDIEQNG
ncbi:MAG: hypothetical protein QM648_05030, partial [Solirubrobacterales bacterium]